MLFSDPIFLFVFLPLAIFSFYVAPKKLKNIVLLFFSLAFYAWGEKKMVLLLLLSSGIDFFAAIIISKKYRKLGLSLSLIFNLGILIYFKYFNFLTENINAVLQAFSSTKSLNFLNIIMPLGISFFTFQTMSYTIDVYKGRVKATYNFINFCTYVSLFPQLVAGPIVRYEHVHSQLENKILTIDGFCYGAERFVKGLFKKIFIANNIVSIADVAFETTNGYGTIISWLGILSYTLHIYYDFSGYSDMAIGLGRIFGFKFPENFNYPYASKSMRDFWRRWHITMSNWFRDYVYISLGGGRKSEQRVLMNLCIVFIVTGLWHGAAWTFIFWGLWHGFFLVLERKKIIDIKGVLSHFYVMLVVLIGFVFFRATTVLHALNYIKQLFWYKQIYDSNILNFVFRIETLVALFFAIILLFPLRKIASEIIREEKIKMNVWILKTPVYIILLLVCYTYIAIGSYNPFIYFRF